MRSWLRLATTTAAARARKFEGDMCPYAAGTTGDDGDLVLQFEIGHAFPLG